MANQIPGPRAWPFIGNMLDMRQGEFPLMALSALAEQYGPVYQVLMPSGRKRIVVSSQRFVNELCDESRFQKLGGAPGNSSTSKREAAGLFFARNDDPDWGQAHRILLPAFGPLNIQTMFDEMHDIAKQLALSWARRGSSHRIDVTDDFTRLTLDSIALCAMGYRFNSFYQSDLHPYVNAMTTMLEGMAQRNSQLNLVSRWQNIEGKIQAATAEMTEIAGQLVQERRANPNDKNDLLNAMINGNDPKTGEKMRDELIMSNMNTFLIAGHETTSGLLSYAMYHLLKDPAAYKAVQEEVDRVIGQDALQAHHLKDLKYINAVLRETLRLHPTAPAFTLTPKGDGPTSLGEYVIDGNLPITVLLLSLHLDPEVYGEDAKLFRPERMLDENFEKLPSNAWKPFGNGMRGCIGRSFAWQEALMAIAISFQRFDFRLDDPSYELRNRFALTIKPKGLYMRASLRGNLDPMELEHALNAGAGSFKPKAIPSTNGDKVTTDQAGASKMKIFYGSNTGTCEALAQRLKGDAHAHGFVVETAPLDSIKAAMPSDGPIAIICSTYEGQPPDNAIHFVEWLQGLSGTELDKVKYAVFGCGHHDWHDTFHRIPRWIDDKIAEHGGERIVPIGVCDVADSDVVDQFDEWKDRSFWPAVSKAPESAAISKDQSSQLPELDVEMSTDIRAQLLRHDVAQAVVLEAKTLTHSNEPQKRHLELQLPSGVSYKAGDYLAVLPLNPAASVRRVTRRFSLPSDAAIKITAEGNTTSLPSNTWLAVHDILRGFVELSQNPSKKDLQRFISLTEDKTTKQALETLLSKPTKHKEHISTLDILEHYPSIALSFSEFLTLCPPLRVRLYSISSSPLGEPSKCSISYSVLDAPGSSGWTTARHQGVASTYLANLQAEDHLHVSVRPSRAGFHLPLANPAHPIPLIMICAGTGLAPFRAFVQERALQLSARSASPAPAGLGEALLFVGCRSQGKDRLYAEELDEWEALGAVATRYAYSREPQASHGCKYVQDRVRLDAKDVKRLWDEGAKVYLCGANGLVREVGVVLREVLFPECGDRSDAREAFARATRTERIVTDVFG